VNHFTWAALGLIPGTKVVQGVAKVAKAASMAKAVQLGRAGEKAAGIVGPKVGITIPGTGVTRFPDSVTSKVLTEVKNVKKLHYTQQLRDYALYAEKNGLTFELYVRSPTGTKLSGPLEAEIKAGRIKLKYLYP